MLVSCMCPDVFGAMRFRDGFDQYGLSERYPDNYSDLKTLIILLGFAKASALLQKSAIKDN